MLAFTDFWKSDFSFKQVVDPVESDNSDDEETLEKTKQLTFRNPAAFLTNVQNKRYEDRGAYMMCTEKKPSLWRELQTDGCFQTYVIDYKAMYQAYMEPAVYQSFQKSLLFPETTIIQQFNYHVLAKCEWTDMPALFQFFEEDRARAFWSFWVDHVNKIEEGSRSQDEIKVENFVLQQVLTYQLPREDYEDDFLKNMVPDFTIPDWRYYFVSLHPEEGVIYLPKLGKRWNKLWFARKIDKDENLKYQLEKSEELNEKEDEDTSMVTRTWLAHYVDPTLTFPNYPFVPTVQQAFLRKFCRHIASTFCMRDPRKPYDLDDAIRTLEYQKRPGRKTDDFTKPINIKNWLRYNVNYNLDFVWPFYEPTEQRFFKLVDAHINGDVLRKMANDFRTVPRRMNPGILKKLLKHHGVDHDDIIKHIYKKSDKPDKYNVGKELLDFAITGVECGIPGFGMVTAAFATDTREKARGTSRALITVGTSLIKYSCGLPFWQAGFLTAWMFYKAKVAGDCVGDKMQDFVDSEHSTKDGMLRYYFQCIQDTLIDKCGCDHCNDFLSATNSMFKWRQTINPILQEKIENERDIRNEKRITEEYRDRNERLKKDDRFKEKQIELQEEEIKKRYQYSANHEAREQRKSDDRHQEYEIHVANIKEGGKRKTHYVESYTPELKNQVIIKKRNKKALKDA